MGAEPRAVWPATAPQLGSGDLRCAPCSSRGVAGPEAARLSSSRRASRSRHFSRPLVHDLLQAATGRSAPRENAGTTVHVHLSKSREFCVGVGVLRLRSRRTIFLNE